MGNKLRITAGARERCGWISPSRPRVRSRDRGCVRDPGRHLAGDRESVARDPERGRKEGRSRTSHATNIQAYDYYLRGRQFFHQLRRREPRYARQMFNKAIELDPELHSRIPASQIRARCSTRTSMRATSTSGRRTRRAGKRSSSSLSLRKRMLSRRNRRFHSPITSAKQRKHSPRR